MSNIALELFDKDLHSDDYIGHVILAAKDLLKSKAIEGPKALQAGNSEVVKLLITAEIRHGSKQRFNKVDCHDT